MTSHVDAETLALSAEGLLDDEQERSVQEHMAECSVCAEQRSALDDVSRLLAGVPAPPLPDSVAARIDDAVRSEIEQRNERSPGTDPGPPSTAGSGGVVPLRRKGGLARWMPYIAAAAAAVFVIGGGAAIVRGIVSPTPTMQGGSNSVTDGEPTEEEPSDAAQSYRPIVVESDTTYSKGKLEEQARSVLGEAAPANAEGSETDADGPGSASLPTPSEVPSGVSSCAHKLSQEGDSRPEVIDLATFQPKKEKGAKKKPDTEDVWVMYFGAASDKGGDEYEVVVVSPECGGGSGSEVDDAVLARTTISDS